MHLLAPSTANLPDIMIKKLLFALVVLAFCQNRVQAQNPLLKTYDQEGIYLRTELLRGTVFVKNGVARPLGFAYKNLRPEFEIAPRVLPLFKKAQRNAKISFAVGILGLAGATTGLLIALRGVDDQGYLLNERQFNRGLNLIWACSIATAVINIPLTVRSRRQLDDAIWLRNRELLRQE